MKQIKTHTYARARSTIAHWVIACVIATMIPGPTSMVPTAKAASSFRPTIFVNTEAFLIIDDDDTSSNVVMRFGDTLAKTLSFNRSFDRFEFNDDVYTSGGLTASGTLVTESGAYIDGTSLVVQANSNNVGIGTAAPQADLHVVGTETRLDTGTTDGSTALSFVDNNDEKAHLSLNQATGTFDIQSDGRIVVGSSDYVNLSGTNYTNIQGSTTFIGNNVGIGKSDPKTRLDVIGAISGSFIYATQSFSGAGLTDCDTAGTSKLLWDATTGRFSCGTDANTTYTAGQGLSLNGTSFRLNATVTGSVIQAANALASSGSLTWKGAGSGKSIAVMQDSYFLGNVGVGTAAPKAKLDVAGTISGSTVSLGGGKWQSTGNGILYSNGYINDVNLPMQIVGSVAQYGVSRTNGTYGLLFGSYDSTTYSMRSTQATDKLSFIVNNTTQALNIIPNGNVGIATTAPKAKLDVVGAISGSFVYATRSFSGAGLSDCDAGTSKLLWDATTGRFSCGTVTSTAYTAGQGLSLNGTSFRLNATVTGSVIKAADSLASSGTLVWEGKGSGASLHVKNFLSVGASHSGSLLTVGRVGSGVIAGTASNATLFSTDQMALGQLEGGAYFGRVGLKENQWGLIDYGNVWTAKGSGNWYAVAMSSDGKVQTAVSAPGTIYVSTDYGNTWTTKDSSRNWVSVAMSSDGKVQTAAVSGGKIYVSVDYGNTWTEKESNRNWGSVAISSDGKVQTAVVFGGKIYTSNDYGNTWTEKESNRAWISVAMSSDGKVQTAAVSGGKIYVSVDYGNTWTGKESNRSWASVAMSSDSRIQTAVPTTGLIYVSVDYGNTWTGKESSQNWTSVAMSSDGKVQTAVGSFEQVYISTDYGNTWTTKETSRDWFAIAMSSDGKVQTAIVPGGQIYVSYASSYQYGSVSIGTGSVKGSTKLMVQGILSGVTLYATKSFSGAGLSDCDTGGTSKLLWDATTGRFSCGTDANTTYTAGQGLTLAGTSFRLNETVTGSNLHAVNALSASGGLSVDQTSGDIAVLSHSISSIGRVRISNNTSGKDAGNGLEFTMGANGPAGASIVNNEADSLYFGTNGLFNMLIDTSGNVGIGSADTTAKARLSVAGTISGATLYATKSFSGAGLSDCDNATNSKLLWDATTGRFSCGTDQSGAGGLTYATASGIFLKRGGGTMTGALSVQSGNSAAATLATLLNVRGTMSGKNLTVMGTGSTALLSTTTDKPTVRIGGSGSLVIEARSTDPGSAPANTASLFAQKVGGRTMLHQGSGSTFAASPLQNALFGNQIMMLTAGGGTTVNGEGTTVTNDTTVSHPAAGEVFGYMTNFATAATANDEAGTSSTNVAFFRGSTAGANGFFYHARVGVVDTTSITVFSGMADQTIATMVGADNPAGNHVGFQFSSGRGDANWQFTTKDNTTQNVANTGMAFTANKVYDLSYTCTKQCASITWEIRNVTDGTSAQGTTSNNLPTAGTALRIVLGVETETTAARNIRMQRIYVEADR